MLRCVNDYLHYISFFGRGQETNCELSVSINIEINPKAKKRGEQASALPTVQKFIMNDVGYPFLEVHLQGHGISQDTADFTFHYMILL